LEIFKLAAHKLKEMLKNGEVSSEEITHSIFNRIEKIEDRIKAYTHINKENALNMAKSADARYQKNERIGIFTGIPIAIKDNICIRGVPTTCSSKILENFVPPYNATVVRRLLEDGAVFIGKTNLDEFAMGSSTENSAFFKTLNPWDKKRVPGGSSGGSAAAVTAAEAIAALGSDTGGSIRQPASFCGVVGIKPTYGRVSRFGLVAFASSLDQIGPLTRDVEDAALLMNVISGYDPKDSTSANLPSPDYISFLNKPINGMKIGIPKEYFIEGMDKEVEQAIRKAIDRLSELGAICEVVSLPHTEYAIATYYLIATAEASSNLARYDGVQYGYRTKTSENIIEMLSKTRQEGFGAEVKRRIMLGTYALSAGYYDAYYLKALKVRTLIKQDFDKVFQSYDAIITPTSPTPAFKIGEKTADPLQMYLSDIFTISVNLAGIAAISLPCGFTESNLPIGMQIMVKPFEEGKMFTIAHAYEQSNDFHNKIAD